jgi:hypothetical protein
MKSLLVEILCYLLKSFEFLKYAVSTSGSLSQPVTCKILHFLQIVVYYNITHFPRMSIYVQVSSPKTLKKRLMMIISDSVEG